MLRSKSIRNNRGFTLVEILVVLGILAAAISIALTRIKKKDTNIKTVARQMSTTVREIRNKAKLYNSTYRLVVNFSAKPNTYYVERATGRVVRDSKEDQEENAKLDKENQPPDPFKIDTSFGKKEKPLPDSLKFVSLETINMPEPISEGLGYVYFSPEGFVEYSAVQVGDGKELTWTLVFNPLTGKADILQTAKSLKDLKQ